MTTGRIDYLERASRMVTLAVLAITIVASIAAPLLAISWSNLPFPGFLVEQTLIVNDLEGADWSGQLSGIDYPQNVLRIGGVAVKNAEEYEAAIASFAIGQAVSVFTRLPVGEEQLFPAIVLTAFPLNSLIRLFWVPYLVGLAYLIVGIWIYRARGMTRPGRALTFFCLSTSITLMLFFDASTTHAATLIWTAGLAQLGGALLSLGLRFPEEWKPVARRSWLLGLPYVVALTLMGWAWATMFSPNPWAYIPVRYALYLFTAIGVLGFLGLVFYRERKSTSETVRRQARIVLLGAALAFAPLTLWFVATVATPLFFFDIALLLAPLVFFPLSLAVAIYRYRLLEVDAIVNRTIFYGIITAVLAGVISVSISLSQRLFLAVTGEKSDIAAVITTLVVVSLFEPIKGWVRKLVDRLFREKPDTTQDLAAFGAEVQEYLMISNAERLARQFLDKAVYAFQAQSGLLSVVLDGEVVPIYAAGNWRGEAWMSVPLECDGRRYGVILLGPRINAGSYTRRECEVLEEIAHQVASAMHLARQMPPQSLPV